jgi:pyrimidine deaminase RibD-like protein
MPLEGHYERQTTPLYKLSKREIWVASTIVVVTLLTVVVLVAFTGASNSNPAPAIGCINPTVAGIVGAETLNRCGQEAVETCAHAAEFEGARAETIVANCEKQDVKF